MFSVVSDKNNILGWISLNDIHKILKILNHLWIPRNSQFATEVKLHWASLYDENGMALLDFPRCDKTKSNDSNISKFIPKLITMFDKFEKDGYRELWPGQDEESPQRKINWQGSFDRVKTLMTEVEQKYEEYKSNIIGEHSFSKRRDMQQGGLVETKRRRTLNPFIVDS